MSGENLLQDPFLVYRNYICVKNHFTRLKYDFFRYNGKSRVKRETFEKRRDSLLFYRVATKYTESENIGFFVSQAIDNELNLDTLGNNFLKAQNIYKEWKKRVGRAEVNFRYDLETIARITGSSWRKALSCSNGYPLIFGLLTSGEITPESYCLIDKIGSFISRCEKRLNDNFFTTMNLKYRKYVSFLEPSQEQIKKAIKESRMK